MRNSRHEPDPRMEFQAALNTAEEIPCQDMPELFFPDDFIDRKTRESVISTAKALCSQCPIQMECLLYAIRAREHYGIWGGTLPNER